jgi:hypothetical protein
MSFLSKDDMKRKGDEFLRKIEKQYEFFSKALESAEDAEVIPLKKGDIPRLAVLLGLLDPFFFDLYSLCDGKKDLKTLSEAIGLDTNAVKIFVDKLVKNGLINKPKDL